MNLNFNKFTSSLTKNADKLGGLVGFFTGSAYGFASIEDMLTQVMRGNVHLPDIKKTFEVIAAEPFVKQGVIMAIIGWIISEAKVPIVGKWGAPLQKFGVGYATGAALNRLLWQSTHSDEGSADHLKTMFQKSVVAPNQSGYGY